MNAEFSALINELIKRNYIDGFKSWQELMSLRVEMNEYVDSQTNEKLSDYEEKIAMKNWFKKCQVPTSEVS